MFGRRFFSPSPVENLKLMAARGGGFPRGGPGGHGGPGFPGFGGFGRGFPFGSERGRGPRARRGDIRAAILALLKETPRNGYQIMQELEQRSGGVWRPSPGSVYPQLEQLADEGLVAVTEANGGREYALTKKGEKYVEAHKKELKEPWAWASEIAGGDRMEVISLLRQMFPAAMQIVGGGNKDQIKEAKRIVSEARRALYRILAEDPGDASDETESDKDDDDEDEKER